MSATATTTTAGRRVSHVLSFRGPSPSSAKPQFPLASRGAAAAAPHPGAACAAAAGPIPTAPALVLLALAVGEVGGKAVPMEWSGGVVGDRATPEVPSARRGTFEQIPSNPGE